MISMIASIGKNNEIGKNNKLIWHISEDMKFFKDTTMGHVVIMGRKTYESLPGSLPGRKMIVITSKNLDEEVQSVKDISLVLNEYLNSEEEVFIIGGAKIYFEFLKYAKKLYLTEINAESLDADSYFPKFDKKEWNKKIIKRGINNDVDYMISLYERKSL